VTQETEPTGAAWGGQTVPPTCPFFRSVAVDGALRAPVEVPDGTNRCAAFGAPRPQSALQQELVCLTSGHVDCPRYLQGAVRVREAAARRERRRQLTRPTTAAMVFLVLAAGAAFGFVLMRGSLMMPAALTSATPTSLVAAADPTPPPAASPSPTPTRPATPVLTPSVTLAPTPPPTPAATPPPTPRPTRTLEPTNARYADLDPCPGESGCWIYTVRSGDSLWAIGDSFGHSLETVYEWNPWARTERLRPGAEVRLPPPRS